MALTTSLFPWVIFSFRGWSEIAIVVAILAVLGVVLTAREKLRKYLTRNWPTCEGAVQNIRFRLVDGGANGVDYYKLTFDYTYSVTQAHSGTYKFNCTSEKMANGAVAGLTGKTVSVHYNPTNEARGILWEDEIWDLWWDTYWNAA